MSDALFPAFRDEAWYLNALRLGNVPEPMIHTLIEQRDYAGAALKVAESRARTLQADLAAAQAVIEQVGEWFDTNCQEMSTTTIDELSSILAQSSSSGLAAHDAEVAAKEAEAKMLDKLADLSPHWKRKELRDRAQALRDGRN